MVNSYHSSGVLKSVCTSRTHKVLNYAQAPSSKPEVANRCTVSEVLKLPSKNVAALPEPGNVPSAWLRS